MGGKIGRGYSLGKLLMGRGDVFTRAYYLIAFSATKKHVSEKAMPATTCGYICM